MSERKMNGIFLSPIFLSLSRIFVLSSEDLSTPTPGASHLIKWGWGRLTMSDDRARDEDLMLRVAGGNREAMSPLVRRYASPLLTFIRRMTGDWHRGEELFQEAFLAVWQNRRRYEYPRPFLSDMA